MKTLVIILTIFWCALCFAFGAAALLSALGQVDAYDGATKYGYYSVPVVLLVLSALSVFFHRFLLGLGAFQLIVAAISAVQILNSQSERNPVTISIALALLVLPVLVSFGLFAWNRSIRIKVPSPFVAEF